VPPLATLQKSNELPSSIVETPPKWVSAATSTYLQHVCLGVPIRELARRSGCHASTILRQVRKIETERDDPLKDEALDRLSASYFAFVQKTPNKTEQEMSSVAARALVENETEVEKEARRILRRLCEAHTFLLVSPEMNKAAVFKEAVPGRRTRIAVVDREVAQVFALKDWIEGQKAGRIGISTAYSESPSPFQDQHREMGERYVAEGDGPRKVRYNLAESPLTALARKKAPDGSRYLSNDLLAAGERLREDFELAQMGPRITQNWENFLTSSTSGGPLGSGEGSDGASRARDRVAAALKDLGPGLADVAFRCCCFLEGLETAEKRLGWSARAGKVVLRIALQRLVEHYERSNDSRLIG